MSKAAPVGVPEVAEATEIAEVCQTAAVPEAPGVAEGCQTAAVPEAAGVAKLAVDETAGVPDLAEVAEPAQPGDAPDCIPSGIRDAPDGPEVGVKSGTPSKDTRSCCPAGEAPGNSFKFPVPGVRIFCDAGGARPEHESYLPLSGTTLVPITPDDDE